MEDKEIVSNVMRKLHIMSLERKYIGWGTFMRAGLKLLEEGRNGPKV